MNHTARGIYTCVNEKEEQVFKEVSAASEETGQEVNLVVGCKVARASGVARGSDERLICGAKRSRAVWETQPDSESPRAEYFC